MRIAVFGLGYVGSTSAGCLALQGHEVIGVDTNPHKVELINQGQSPIIESEVGEIIAEMVSIGRLRATEDAREAVAASDISLICVGTPSRANGSLSLKYVRNVAADIGTALGEKDDFHVVTVRSTMLPGSLDEEITPILEEKSGKRAGVGFGVAVNPEFLREGSAVKDYFEPSFTLVGAEDPRSGKMVESLYAAIDAPVVHTDVRTAEMEKYVSNAFHALKVAFANEIGVLCKAMKIDSHRVMEIFARDTKLNISDRYLTPGFAFGGSCLPKDLRAMNHRARRLDLQLNVLDAILPSNQVHIDRAVDMVQRSGSRRVGIMGLSFKAGTDDLRESPIVQLAEILLGKGYDLRIYDPNVSLSQLTGANKSYISQVIPHIAALLVEEMEELIEHAEVVVLGNRVPDSEGVIEQLKPGQMIIDLIRIDPAENHFNGTIQYEGVCW